MKKYNMITPEGTKDILFEECIARRKIEKKIKNVFTKRAYNEVISPGLEYYDVFNLENASIPQYEMYKTTDNKGRLVVFRPDLTLPVARIASTRLKQHKGVSRLFYNQTVYRNRKELSGRSDECTQAGIELLGASGLMADVEVIATAIEALNSCNINFRLEIGHAGLFKYIAEKLGVDEDTKEKIRSTIESKNYALINDIIAKIDNSKYSEAIKKLPRLFGGEEVFDEALQICCDKKFTDILFYLQSLYKALSKLGLGDKIIIDLGLVQRNDYYTGVVFSAYTQGFGSAILSGGRYDKLMEKFSSPMPAVGFALEVDAITNILLPQEKIKSADFIVFGELGKEIEVQIKINELTKQGFVCQTSFCKNPDETLAFARENGISKMIILDESEREVLV